MRVVLAGAKADLQRDCGLEQGAGSGGVGGERVVELVQQEAAQLAAVVGHVWREEERLHEQQRLGLRVADQVGEGEQVERRGPAQGACRCCDTS